jgi:heme/copper-type cytochrome/quinol oxidase subunit 4
MQDPELPPKECCADLSRDFNAWKERAEKSVREEPIKTAGLAFVAGIVLTVLPVGAILGALVRIALALVRPALLIFGVVKIFQQIDRRNSDKPSNDL